jgi:threonine dehydratase
MPALEPVSLKAIRETQGRLTDTVLRTPLVRLNVDDSAAEIFLKLENLQPIGSFELRGAGDAMQLAKKTVAERSLDCQGLEWGHKAKGSF